MATSAILGGRQPVDGQHVPRLSPTDRPAPKPAPIDQVGWGEDGTRVARVMPGGQIRSFVPGTGRSQGLGRVGIFFPTPDRRIFVFWVGTMVSPDIHSCLWRGS